MVSGWAKRTNEQISELYDSTVPIVCEWHDDQGNELTLYADGAVAGAGHVPVELLAYVLVDWHAYARTGAAILPSHP
jgi:hypothetical protein